MGSTQLAVSLTHDQAWMLLFCLMFGEFGSTLPLAPMMLRTSAPTALVMPSRSNKVNAASALNA